MKKSLSLLLALTLVFGLFASMASAAETELTTAQKYQWFLDEGVLKGDTSGDPNLGGKLTRAQFATIIAAIGGLEPATSGQTFSDVKPSQWWYGDIEAAAQEGLVNGTGGGKFSPKADVTVEAVVKVAVLLLGLTPEKDAVVAGTSTWAGPYFKVAIDKGLIPAAAAAGAKLPATRGQTIDIGFTAFAAITVPTVKSVKAVNGTTIEVVFSDDAAAQTFTVDALTPNKEETRTVTYKEKAYDVKVTYATTAQATEVVAIDSTTIKVTFDNAVTAAASAFTLVDASAAAVAITSATSADAGKVAVLKVPALTIGNKYTLSYGGKSFDVVATLADDTTTPALSSAAAVTGEIVRATFGTRNINKDTLVAANFTLDQGATVTAVEVDTAKNSEDGQEGNTNVLLTVTGISSGKAFTLTSKNVASYEGAVATTSTAVFAGKDADKTAPTVAGAVSEGGYKVDVTFTEDGKLDASALVLTNYTITPALEIKSAAFKKNTLGNNVVTLTTSDQKSGIAYTVSVNNVSDGKNVQTVASTATFAGKDKVANQVLASAVANDAKQVEVTFTYEANATALVAANYTINNSITVESAAFKEDSSEADGLDQKKVILTLAAATPLKSGTAYTLTGSTALQDTLNQGLTAATSVIFAGKDPDTSFAGASAVSADKNTVTVTFNEPVDRASALALANYKISGIGYPSSVTLNSAGTVATLKTATQTAGTSYSITLNNIKDKAGNTVTANTAISFTGKGDVVDRLKVVSVAALNKNKIKVTFNQPLAANGDLDEAKLVVTLGSTTIGQTNTAVATVGVDYIILTTTTDLSSNNVYTLTIPTNSELTGNITSHTFATTESGDRIKTFVGNSETSATFGIASQEVLYKRHVAVTFAQATTAQEGSFVAGALTLNTKSDFSGTSFTSTTNAKVSDDGKTIVFELNGDLDNNTIYYAKLNRLYGAALNIATTDGSVLAVESGEVFKKLQFVSGSSLIAAADAKLDIASAQQTDVNTLKVTFNLDTNKSAALTNAQVIISNTNNGATVADVKYVEWLDRKTANIYFTGHEGLNNASGIEYVRIDGAVLATWIGGATAFATDKAYESFAKASAANAKPTISLVEPLTDTVIKITASEKVFSNAARATLVKQNLILFNQDSGTLISNGDYSITVEGDKVIYLTLTNGVFQGGANYQVGFATSTFGIDGIVAADVYAGTSTTTNSVNFGGVAATFNTSVTGVAYNATTNTVTITAPSVKAAHTAAAANITIGGVTLVTADSTVTEAAGTVTIVVTGATATALDALTGTVTASGSLGWVKDTAGNRAAAFTGATVTLVP